MIGRWVVASLAAGSLAFAALPVQQAAAAPDKTGPTFTLQSSAHIVAPSLVIGESTPFSGGDYRVTAIQKWSASDPSGICDYQLYEDDGRGDPTLYYEGKNTSFQFTMGDVEEFNGGYYWFAWALRVEDCAGNWSSNDSSFWPTDRYIPQHGVRNSTVTYDDNQAAYTGTWTKSSCACFVLGTDVHAATAGASASFTYTGNVFAWVSETGPARGSAKVYQDGKLVATISTYSATNSGAKVMWSNWFSVAGTHTIKIVVVGTAGHPRVDVDGFLVGPDPGAS